MAVPSIKDQINTTLQDFNFEDFGVVKEVEEYLGDLFGIDDLIADIQGVLNKLEAFKDAIMKIIEQVLALFDMVMDFFSDIFGAIIGGILGVVSAIMSGGSLFGQSTLDSIKDLLCNNQSMDIGMSSFADLKDILSKITFGSLIFASLCTGKDDVFSKSLNNHRTSEDGTPLSQEALDKVDNTYIDLLPGVLGIRGVKGNVNALNDISLTDIPGKALNRYPNMLKDSVSFIGNIKNVSVKDGKSNSFNIRSILNRIDNTNNKPYVNPSVISKDNDIKKLFKLDLLSEPAGLDFSSSIPEHTFLDAF